MGSIISAHNQRLLTPNISFFECNWRNNSNCPLEGKCLTPKVIYQADVTNDVDDGLETTPNRLIINDTKTKQNCLNTSRH